MNRAIKRVGFVVTILVVALVAQLTWLQVFHAEDLANDPRNVRTLIRDFDRSRGDIVTADGVVVATSVEVDDQFGFQRLYPTRDLFAHTVGYQSFVVGSAGVEATYNDALIGRDADLQIRNLGDLLLGEQAVGNVELTMRSDVQQVARDSLGSQRGSVVALDPTTGGLLALWTNPSFDPQPLASHSSAEVQLTFDALRADPANPALPRAYREIYPPGSTFKVVTAGVALDAGASLEREYPSIRELDLPQTNTTIANFGTSTCGGDLAESFRRSCNTTFAQVGLDLAETFATGMQAWGVNRSPPIDLRPGAVESLGPLPGSFQDNQPRFALAGIGQGDVFVTPIEMALVAAGVANDGVIMTPHVGDRIVDDEGRVAGQVEPGPWTTAATPATAATLTDFMVSVVERGTGTAAQIPGVTVAGKTGTAQNDLGDPHAWFIAFAPAEAPRVAVAVIVEQGGDFGSEATGGQIAAPIARAVIQAALGL